jgi:hypothetical protein
MLINNLNHILFNADGNNLPGICAISIIDKDSITSMPDLKKIMASPTMEARFNLSEIVLAPGKTWFSILSDFILSAELSIKSKSGLQGSDLKIYNLGFNFPDDTYERSKILLAYEKRELILRVKFVNHTEILIGSLYKGCKLAEDYNSGRLQNGSNKYDANITYESSLRHFYINP